MCQEIVNMSTLKEILDFERTIDFLQQDANGTIVVICTTNNSKEFIVWKKDKWENVIGKLKDCTMHINVWVCKCEKESFGYLMFIVHKIIIGSYIEYKIGTYFPQLEELPSMCNIVIKSPLHFFVYFFRRNVGEDVDKKALENNQLPNSIVGKYSMHMEICQVYK